MLAANYMWSHAINDGYRRWRNRLGSSAECVLPRVRKGVERSGHSSCLLHEFLYQLPFGAGKRLLAEPGLARTIFGGWSLSWIATARSGRPVNVTIKRSAADVPNGYNLSQRQISFPASHLSHRQAKRFLSGSTQPHSEFLRAVHLGTLAAISVAAPILFRSMRDFQSVSPSVNAVPSSFVARCSTF